MATATSNKKNTGSKSTTNTTSAAPAQTNTRYTRKNRPFRTNDTSDLKVIKAKMENAEEATTQNVPSNQTNLFGAAKASAEKKQQQAAAPAESAPKAASTTKGGATAPKATATTKGGATAPAKGSTAKPTAGKDNQKDMKGNKEKENKNTAPKGKAKEAPVAEAPQPKVASNPDPESLDLIIKHTKDYSIFKFSEANRDIKRRQVNDLVEKISSKNLLHSMPVVVNSNMEVMDGQHRIEAAKEVGAEVYYIIDDNFAIEDISMINSTAQKWSLEDFLKHFVAEGKKEYIKLAEFVDNYKFNIYTSIGLLSGRNSQPNADLVKEFKDGKFKVKSMEHAVKVANLRDKMKPFAKKFYKSKLFVGALSKIARVDGFDENSLIEKAEQQSERVQQCATVEGYTENLLDIYNWRLRKAQHLKLAE